MAGKDFLEPSSATLPCKGAGKRSRLTPSSETQTVKADSADTFAANRAVGRLALAVAAASGESRRARVHEAGSLRVRFPNGTSTGTLDAVIVNTAGGMTGGDRFDIDIDSRRRRPADRDHRCSGKNLPLARAGRGDRRES